MKSGSFIKQHAAETAFMSLRVWPGQWFQEDRFAGLLSMLGRHRGVADEIAFQNACTLSPVPLTAIHDSANVLRDRIMRSKAAGYRAGINVVATLGHNDEYAPDALHGDFTRMTDVDGSRSAAIFCSNDVAFREYVAELYRTMAEADPDFIWIDDDMRFNSHGTVRFGCFCDTCIRLFNEANGLSHTRESLVTAFDAPPFDGMLNLRRAWLTHNANSIVSILAFIERNVHQVNPEIQLGQMTTQNDYDGNELDRWVAALSGASRTAVKWRPGSGFWSDEIMRNLLSKSHHIGMSNSLLPETVSDIQSEIESWPYQPLGKSAHTMAVEVAAYIAAGSTGAAYNILGFFDESPEEYEPLLQHLAARRPFFDLLVKIQGRCKPIGVSPAWNRKVMASNHPQGKWLGTRESPFCEYTRAIYDFPMEFLQIGLPSAYSPAAAEVTLLAGDTPLAFDRPELEDMLSRSVYMDGRALARIHEMGLGELTGFKVAGWVDRDCAEILTDDLLNGIGAGRSRESAPRIWPCAILEQLDDSARILARKIKRNGADCSFPCMGIYENASGGRVAVAGYAPWTTLYTSAKALQLKSLFRWLSRDTLSGYVDSFHKISLWLRRDENGRIAAVVLNASQDAAEELVISIRTKNTRGTVTNMNCKETTISASEQDGLYMKFQLPAIAPWHLALLTV